MRVSLGIHNDIENVIKTYKAMSNKKFIHAHLHYLIVVHHDHN